MSSRPSFVHAAVLATGAVIGGGIATLTYRNKPAPVDVLADSEFAPVVRVSSTGKRMAMALNTAAASGPPALKYGSPGPISDLLVRKAYVAGYDRRMKHPAWTAEHLTYDRLAKDKGDRDDAKFIEDVSIPATFRSRLDEYRGSGYDRGHMVPAADAKMDQEAMNETFLLSNMAPQVGEGFNRHYWAHLEEWCRKITYDFTDVYVFTVPLYIPKQDPDGKWRVTHEVIGSAQGVSVPTHFAKVLVTTKSASPENPDVIELATGAFVLPNAPISDKIPLENFKTNIDVVERYSGLIFLSDEIKARSKDLCKSTKCDLSVRKFVEAKKQLKELPAPSDK